MYITFFVDFQAIYVHNFYINFLGCINMREASSVTSLDNIYLLYFSTESRENKSLLTKITWLTVFCSGRKQTNYIFFYELKKKNFFTLKYNYLLISFRTNCIGGIFSIDFSDFNRFLSGDSFSLNTCRSSLSTTFLKIKRM